MRIIINTIVVKRNVNTIIQSITLKFSNRYREEAKKKRRRSEEVVAKNSFMMFPLEWN